MLTFMDSQEKMKETAERCLDSQLWHACAGSMVQMPPVNSKVFYFPQGHAEHASGTVDFRACPRLPPYIPCRVSGVKFMADPESDEVFAKIRLTPYSGNEVIDFDDSGGGGGVVSGLNGTDNQEKPASFAKTLTQSDANNGGGFSVPRYCAETIFPRLDYNADPPVQNILAKDVHGETWKFRHIYRGTPRRHLLTTGWSTFVNHKKLIAGDSIVFLRAENGDLCVGIRRAKRGIGGGPDSSSSGWNTSTGNSIIPYGGLSAFLREDDGKLMRNGNGSNSGSSLMGRGRVKVESVVEAATLAANGRPFEVIYYPRASTPEFCVKASLVKSALRLRWCSGMRFKMPFETEDSSRISWFMGTISSVQVADPILWPDSPWRLLQVTWDEPDLLQNVKRVSPWLVELVSNMPTIHLSPFSPPRKKLRLPQHPEFPLDGQISIPTFPGNHLFGSNSPFGCLGDNIPAGMQGARHAQYGLSLSDIQFKSGLFPVGLHHFDRSAIPRIHHNNKNNNNNNSSSSGNVSCLLSMGSSAQPSKKFASENGKKATTAQFVLFGQPILTEQQISLSNSSACVLDDVVSPVRTGNSSSDGNNPDKLGNTSDGSGSAPPPPTNVREQQRLSCDDGFESNLETGHCKVFMESEDVGRTLDLSLLRSYEELYGKLATMFNIGSSNILNHVLYRDSTGCVRQLGLEPFSDFTRTAKRLTIQTDSSSDNVGT